MNIFSLGHIVFIASAGHRTLHNGQEQKQFAMAAGFHDIDFVYTMDDTRPQVHGKRWSSKATHMKQYPRSRCFLIHKDEQDIHDKDFMLCFSLSCPSCISM
jgi:hypothetical protein